MDRKRGKDDAGFAEKASLSHKKNKNKKGRKRERDLTVPSE